jgi:hypothetical protein
VQNAILNTLLCPIKPMRQKAELLRKPKKASSPKAGFNPARRRFLRAVAFGGAALGTAITAGGCTSFQMVRAAIKSSKEEKIFAGLSCPKMPSPQELPDLKADWEIIKNNLHMFTSSEKSSLKGKHEEWLSLSGFLHPESLPPADGMAEIGKHVFAVYQAASRGSGMLITPRHVLTAAHVVDGSKVFTPSIWTSPNPGEEPGQYEWSIKTTLRKEMDLALLTFARNTFPMDASGPLVRMHHGVPTPGSTAHVIGYPHRELKTHGYNTSLLKVDCEVMRYSPPTSTIGLRLVGERPLLGEAPYLDYARAGGIRDVHGMSGSPVVSGDGRILGLQHHFNSNSELFGVQEGGVLIASGTRAIRTLVTDYLLEKVARPIIACAQAIRERLSD